MRRPEFKAVCAGFAFGLATLFTALGPSVEAAAPRVKLERVRGKSNRGARYFEMALRAELESADFTVVRGASKGRQAPDVAIKSVIRRRRRNAYIWKLRLVDASSGEVLSKAVWKYSRARDAERGFLDNAALAAVAVVKKFAPFVQQVADARAPAAPEPPAAPDTDPAPAPEAPPVAGAATAGETSAAETSSLAADSGLPEIESDEDPFAEEGSGAPEIESDEDPFADEAGEDDPFAEEGEPEDDRGDEADESKFVLDAKQRYRAMPNYLRGVFTGSNRFTDDRVRLGNAYQLRLIVSPDAYPQLYFYVRFASYFHQSYRPDGNQYIDSHRFILRELYFNYSIGNHNIRVGNQIVTLGKIDIGSPIDVLNPVDLAAFETLEVDEFKRSVFLFRYSYSSGPHAVRGYFAPLSRLDYETLSVGYLDTAIGPSNNSDTIFRLHAGASYEYSSDVGDFRLGLFRWGDTPAVTASLNPLLGLTRVTSVSELLSVDLDNTSVVFASAEADVSLGPFVLKADVGYFFERNYPVLAAADANNEVQGSGLSTIKRSSFAGAASVEALFGGLFLLGTYSISVLPSAPANTHVLFYEENGLMRSEATTLIRHRAIGVLLYSWTDGFDTGLTYTRAWPFREQLFAGVARWSPQGTSTAWELRLAYGDASAQGTLSQELEALLASLQFTYEF